MAHCSIYFFTHSKLLTKANKNSYIQELLLTFFCNSLMYFLTLNLFFYIGYFFGCWLTSPIARHSSLLAVFHLFSFYFIFSLKLPCYHLSYFLTSLFLTNILRLTILKTHYLFLNIKTILHHIDHSKHQLIILIYHQLLFHHYMVYYTNAPQLLP